MTGAGARRALLLAAGIGFGLMWLTAAATKVLDPLPAYEFTARIVGPGPAAKAGLVLEILLESWLGGAMALRAVRGLGLTLALLGLTSALLVHVWATAEQSVLCGCFPALSDGTVVDALVRNGVLGALLTALLLWDAAARRSEPAPAA